MLRHGQSAWNQANQFTGWNDVDLTGQGIEESHRAGQFLRETQSEFDLAFTSLLKRAIHTLWIVLDEMDRAWLPVVKDWRLNERHYGALQGLNKAEIAREFGPDQVFRWRRSYDVRPPLLAVDDPRQPRFDPRYAGIDPALLPGGESLKDTLGRVMPCWGQLIEPALRQGKRVLVVAHGNSLRALVTYLDRIPEEEVPRLNIPTGIPLAYALKEDGTPLSRAYLGDPDVIRQALAAAEKAAQVKAK